MSLDPVLFDIEPSLVVELMPGAVAIGRAGRTGNRMQRSGAIAVVLVTVAGAVVVDHQVLRASQVFCAACQQKRTAKNGEGQNILTHCITPPKAGSRHARLERDHSQFCRNDKLWLPVLQEPLVAPREIAKMPRARSQIGYLERYVGRSRR